MKKKAFSTVMALVLGCSTLIGAAACGKSSTEGGNKGMISVDPLTVEQLGTGFNAQYLPDKANIK